jgi:hypothetical protein
MALKLTIPGHFKWTRYSPNVRLFWIGHFHFGWFLGHKKSFLYFLGFANLCWISHNIKNLGIYGQRLSRRRSLRRIIKG